MIRFAKPEDITRVMEFIDCYWKKGHILGKSYSFFKYEFYKNDKVNFVISEEDGDINGIIGFISYSEEDEKDIAGVMWKVIKTDSLILGIELLKFMIDNSKCRIAMSPGINKNTIPIYEWLGYSTGKLKHFYRIGNQEKLKLAICPQWEAVEITESMQYELLEINSFEQLTNKFSFDEYRRLKTKPYKSKEYIERRYFNHPIYKYKVYGIEEKEKIETFLVAREVNCNGATILRIVDCIGKWEKVRYIGNAIGKILNDYAYEYVDFYQTGISDEIMTASGFRLKDESTTMIPNYFEPFLSENIDIYYFSTDAEITLFKGDGDQDRPSSIEG